MLSKIPNELKHYFYRGVFDGDGCFYYNKKNCTRHASIDSTYEQDWSYVENILKELFIKYDIRMEIRKDGSKFSHIRIWGFESLMKWGKFIYSGYNEDSYKNL